MVYHRNIESVGSGILLFSVLYSQHFEKWAVFLISSGKEEMYFGHIQLFALALPRSPAPPPPFLPLPHLSHAHQSSIFIPISMLLLHIRILSERAVLFPFQFVFFLFPQDYIIQLHFTVFVSSR